MLDEATVALEEAIHQIQSVFVSFDQVVEPSSAPDEGDDFAKAVAEETQKVLDRGRRTQYTEDLQKCGAARDRMILARQRIAIRVGVDDPLDAAYRHAISLVIDTIRQIAAAEKRKNAGEQVSSGDFDARNSELGAAGNLFVNLAVTRVRSRLP